MLFVAFVNPCVRICETVMSGDTTRAPRLPSAPSVRSVAGTCSLEVSWKPPINVDVVVGDAVYELLREETGSSSEHICYEGASRVTTISVCFSFFLCEFRLGCDYILSSSTGPAAWHAVLFQGALLCRWHIRAVHAARLGRD